MTECDVIIVGAGISGLSGAKWLTENKVSVIVLEARDRVGGRTLTEKNPNVNYVDIGGAYIGPTQDRILRLAKELGVEHYKIKEDLDLLHYTNGRRIRFKEGDDPKINLIVDMDINHITSLIDKMGEEIPAEAPWKARQAEQWDSITMQTFLEKHCWTKTCYYYYKHFTNINLACEPYETSVLGFLWYIKQCGGKQRIHSTKNGAQERKFVGGSQQISEKIAKDLGDEVVIMNSPVVGINQESKDHVVVNTLNGGKYKAKYVILACPPSVQMKIHFSPPLPALRNQLMQRMPMGSNIKTILYYKTPFWRHKGLCGSISIDQEDIYPVTHIMEDSKPDGSYPSLISFISGDKARELLHLSPKDRRDLFATSVADVTGCPEAREPIHYEEKNWMEEEYSGGCYTAVYTPGLLTKYGKALREPIDRLYFAGTETAVKWSGYMDGAVEAGERAAREILCKMGKITQDKIWLPEAPSEDIVDEAVEETKGKYLPSIKSFLKMITFSTCVGIASLVFMQYKTLAASIYYS